MRCFFFLLCITSFTLYAQQSGEWIPSNTKLSNPRSLMSDGEYEDIIRFIELPEQMPLYSGICSSVNNTVPAGNEASNDRRSRARLAKNCAFVVYIGKTVENNVLRDLSDSESDRLIDKSILLLKQLNTSVPELSISSPNAYEDWQWRSKELMDMLCAYDLLKGKGLTTADLDTARYNLLRFSARLYEQATKSILGLTFFGTVKNNHALMTAGALGLSAIVLSDIVSAKSNEQPKLWFEVSLSAINDILWKAQNSQSNSDGTSGYSEGPYYLRYAMLNVLPFIKSLSHYVPDTNFTIGAESIRHPFYDTRYLNLIKWAIGILQPDGNFPAIGDTYINMGFPESALMGNSNLVFPFTPQEMSAQLQSTVDLRANYIAAHTKPERTQQNGLTVWNDAGSAVIRTADTKSPTYIHALAKNGKARTSGAGHSQADASSFVLWNNGKTMALDAGYVQYSKRNEVGNASNHNMILVDGEGPPIGQPLNAGNADAFFRNSFTLPNIHYVDIETSYNQASISRSIISIADSFILVSDYVKANTPKEYTFQLHGNGKYNGNEQTGLCTFENVNGGIRASWQKDSAQLDAVIVSTNEKNSRLDSAVHEEMYNVTGTHSVARVQTGKNTSASFGCLLSPKRRYSLYPRAVFADRLSDTVSVLGYEYGADQYVVASIQSDTLLRHIRAVTMAGNGFDVHSDAVCALVWQGKDFWDYAIVLKQGTLFRDDFTQYDILSSDKRVTMAVSAQINGFKGYVSKPCTLRHRLLNLIPHLEEDSLRISSVTGNILSWGQDSIVFHSAGEFTITVESKTLYVKESIISSKPPFPHPTHTILTVPIGDKLGFQSLDVTDEKGNTLVVPFSQYDTSIVIVTEHLPCGTYTATLRFISSTEVIPFIKVH